MKARSYQIDSTTEYQRVKKTVSKKNQPSKVLRFLMNALESYRQARKLGWSRPWNKYDLTVFQAFKLKISDDKALLNQLACVLESDVAMPLSAKSFADELMADEKHLMGFLFVHDYLQDGQLYEGVTVSLGRVNDKRFRDRIDLIFESPVCDGRSLGFCRIRAYIDPYMGAKEPLWSYIASEHLSTQACQLFEELSRCSWSWAEQAERHWSHWTAEYIDYFAARKQPLEMSYFYQKDLPESRIQNSADRAA